MGATDAGRAAPDEAPGEPAAPAPVLEPGEPWWRPVQRRLLGVLPAVRALLRLRAGQRGYHVRLPAGIRLRLAGRFFIGDLSFFCPGIVRSEVVSHPGAELRIGRHCAFNWGVSLEAHQGIRIGDYVMVAPLVRICDRDQSGCSPVVIEDRVWIGHGAIIGPGVVLGEGSVVSAGSVVTSSVPARMVAVGNPARCMPMRASPRGETSKG